MKRKFCMFLAFGFFCFQCSEVSTPSPVLSVTRSRPSSEALESIKVASVRANLVMKQFKLNQKNIKPEDAFTYGLSEYRKLITEPGEEKAFDLLTNHSEFKGFQGYLQEIASQVKKRIMERRKRHIGIPMTIICLRMSKVGYLGYTVT